MKDFRATFYTVRSGMRQWRRFAAVGLLAGLAGCSQISFPIATSDTEQPVNMTGTVIGMQDEAADRDVAATDRGIIASTLASAPTSDEPAPTQLAWVNPETGNQGTIFEIVDADPKQAGGCRRFTTTANTIEGVRNYSGIACPDSFDTWHVTVLQPADAGA